MDSIKDLEDGDRIEVLINMVSPTVYNYISECDSFDEAIKRLEQLYVNPRNELFARYKLRTHRQSADQTIDQFL
ncbi:hypothetical protein GJ496_004976 [Pomphorhynchus laevis]|nr:hypothetical protein GJ496_004976 [Pomphorhynchus laevis]